MLSSQSSDKSNSIQQQAGQTNRAAGVAAAVAGREQWTLAATTHSKC